MPDAHAGKGMPIGGVLATNGVIVPNAVGVDIGCGMCAIKTNLKAEDFSYTDLTSIMSKIRAVIPLGFDHQNKKQDQELLPQGFDFEEMPVLKNQYEACLKQIGTLGGGNHFIEIQKDTLQWYRDWLTCQWRHRGLGETVGGAGSNGGD